MHGFVYECVRSTSLTLADQPSIRTGELKDLGISMGPNGPVVRSDAGAAISPEVAAAVERRFVHSHGHDRRRSRVHAHSVRSRR